MFYCSESCVMDAWNYQAGVELKEPETVTYCANCTEYITAYLPAFIATGTGEKVAN